MAAALLPDHLRRKRSSPVRATSPAAGPHHGPIPAPPAGRPASASTLVAFWTAVGPMSLEVVALGLFQLLDIYWLGRLLFATPELKDNPLASQGGHVALATSLLFVCHPIERAPRAYPLDRVPLRSQPPRGCHHSPG